MSDNTGLKIVSKLFDDAEAAADEFRMLASVARYDPNGDFTVHPLQMCTPSASAMIGREDVALCTSDHDSAKAAKKTPSSKSKKPASSSPKPPKHPAVAQILMPFAGESIGALKAPIAARDFLPALARLAQGVARLEASGIVHRDIKPDNVLWDAERKRLTLIDFGLSAPLERAYDAQDKTGSAVLDFHYAYYPPEFGLYAYLLRPSAEGIGTRLSELARGVPSAFRACHRNLVRAVKDVLRGVPREQASSAAVRWGTDGVQRFVRVLLAHVRSSSARDDSQAEKAIYDLARSALNTRIDVYGLGMTILYLLERDRLEMEDGLAQQRRRLESLVDRMIATDPFQRITISTAASELAELARNSFSSAAKRQSLAPGMAHRVLTAVKSYTFRSQRRSEQREGRASAAAAKQSGRTQSAHRIGQAASQLR
jgi:serine/threonine protein kinase